MAYFGTRQYIYTMEIKDDMFYPVMEAHRITGIPKRTLQRRAKKQGNRIIDNRYMFTGLQLKEYLRISRKKASTPRQTEKATPTSATILGAVKSDIMELIQDIDNDEYLLKVLGAIKNEKHLEEFSEDEYQQFRDRLIEATNLEKRIAEYKEEIQRMENYVLDYRNNIEYLKKSLDKRAEETSIILKTIEQRNFIEAKKSDLDKE
jgi:phenylpyruvate tautomerase PptA (4-oxalocrotonate tautomerase family)